MKSAEKRDFDKGASQWEADLSRVKMANGVADAIIREVSLSKDMKVLDFGCGTGLVTLRLQPLVGAITGADSSPGMLAVLEEKIRAQELTNIRTALVNFEKGDRIEEKFHLIVCSMTLHHVPDTAALFKLWHEMLLPGGYLCLADLDTEDGSFHSDKTGLFHLGFDRESLSRSLQETGFSGVRATTATAMSREVAGQGRRDFPIFLLVARKL
jgi:ubiquinone/menaquinone biosynthesis C-methylase UbiE